MMDLREKISFKLPILRPVTYAYRPSTTVCCHVAVYLKFWHARRVYGIDTINWGSSIVQVKTVSHWCRRYRCWSCAKLSISYESFITLTLADAPNLLACCFRTALNTEAADLIVVTRTSSWAIRRYLGFTFLFYRKSFKFLKASQAENIAWFEWYNLF